MFVSTRYLGPFAISRGPDKSSRGEKLHRAVEESFLTWLHGCKEDSGLCGRRLAPSRSVLNPQGLVKQTLDVSLYIHAMGLGLGGQFCPHLGLQFNLNHALSPWPMIQRHLRSFSPTSCQRAEADPSGLFISHCPRIPRSTVQTAGP